MYKDKTVGVVVPCYNEELLITRVIQTMPDYVDKIYVVDDRSSDNTVAAVEPYVKQQEGRVILLQHTVNQGVGGAIITGYLKAAEDGVDVVAVMAGDAQMDPDDLIPVIEPVVEGVVDYTKGNRLVALTARQDIPRVRYFGNFILSLLTKIASGYWHIFDSQTGYTAISRQVIQTIEWDRMWKRYGYPNHLLVLLNIHNFRVRDVPVRPVYNIGEKSNIRIWRVIPTVSLLLVRSFFMRLYEKYILRDAHPLVLFFFFGLITFIPGLLAGFYLVFFRLFIGAVAPTSALFVMFLMLFGLNFLMFGLWFDMDYNRDLK